MIPIIKVEKPAYIKGTEGARRDWAEVTGKELMLSPPIFKHLGTNEYYCNIVGGVAYPVAVSNAIKPGIVIIIGIQSDPDIKFRILDTFEHSDVFMLIEGAIDMRIKYGFGQDSRILPCFYGDQEKYQTLVVKTSEALEKANGPDAGLYIKDTVDMREKNAFPLYIRQLFNALKTGRFEKPSESGDTILTGHLQGLQREDAETGKIENFPAIGLLGGMIHSLQIERPWMQSIDGTGACFNIEF